MYSMNRTGHSYDALKELLAVVVLCCWMELALCCCEASLASACEERQASAYDIPVKRSDLTVNCRRVFHTRFASGLWGAGAYFAWPNLFVSIRHRKPAFITVSR
jgi:hypothetical protein